MFSIIRRIYDWFKRDEITVGDRGYEIWTFPGSQKQIVYFDTMLRQAKEKKFAITKDDLNYFFRCQDDIPDSLRGRMIFALVVGNERFNDETYDIVGLAWSPNGLFIQGLDPNFEMSGSYKFVRCKS